MGVRLQWSDLNFGEDSHKIYRDTSPMNPLSLPPALDTIGANVTQYDDGTTVGGLTYYYRVSAVAGASEKVSDEVSIAAFEFTPDDLFDSSQVGAWYDISDLTTLWTDVSGTTAVTSDGDLVARIDDKSGNGFTLLQGTTSKQPVYHTDGSRHWLTFDGVNDVLLHSPNLGMFRNIGAGLVGLAIRTAPTGNDERMIHISNGVVDGAARTLIRTNSSSGNIEINGRRLDGDSIGTLVVTGEDYTDDSAYISHLDYANSDVFMYEDGVEIGSNTSFLTDGNTSDTDSVGMGIGATSANADFAGFEIYNIVMVGDSSFTAQQIADLSTWLNLKINGG